MSGDGAFNVERDGHVVWLTFNRPEKRNSMNMAFFDGLNRLMPAFNDDPEVRAIILKAEGKGFTAGIDLFELAFLIQGDGAGFRERLGKEILRLQKSMNVIEMCRKPVIAAVHGYCIGGGVDLLSACDIRLATHDAVFSIRETRLAMIADLGTLQRLPHIIGHGWFRELALTGRDFSADEAYQMGFLTRVCQSRDDLYEEAGKLAAQIAAYSPLAVQGTKEVILFSRDNGIYPGLEYVAQKNAAVLQSKDLMEAVKAFMEKRSPEFKGE